MSEPLLIEDPAAARRRRWVKWGLVLAGLILCACADMPMRHWVYKRAVDTEVEDWAKMFRSGGYLPTWLIVAAVFVVVDRAAVGRWGWAAVRKAVILISGVVLTGIAVEIAKLIFRRQRPGMSHSWYWFRPFTQKPFNNSGLSLPSSHAAVAFGAAFALAELFPSASLIFIAFAIGTGVSRVLAGAHYVSDIYVAAVFGAVISRWVRRTADRLAAQHGAAPVPAQITPTGG